MAIDIKKDVTLNNKKKCIVDIQGLFSKDLHAPLLKGIRGTVFGVSLKMKVYQSRKTFQGKCCFFMKFQDIFSIKTFGFGQKSRYEIFG